jgi:hypothetical protein
MRPDGWRLIQWSSGARGDRYEMAESYGQVVANTPEFERVQN